jgi:hypothetical protein
MAVFFFCGACCCRNHFLVHFSPACTRACGAKSCCRRSSLHLGFVWLVVVVVIVVVVVVVLVVVVVDVVVEVLLLLLSLHLNTFVKLW